MLILSGNLINDAKLLKTFIAELYFYKLPHQSFYSVSSQHLPPLCVAQVKKSNGARILKLTAPLRAEIQDGFWSFLHQFGFHTRHRPHSRPLLPQEVPHTSYPHVTYKTPLEDNKIYLRNKVSQLTTQIFQMYRYLEGLTFSSSVS
jgi:hypothetical protein